MNIVEMLQGQLSGPLLGQLSSYLGMSEQTVRPAAQATVPALLSSMSGVASTPGGARQVIQALEQFAPGAPDSLSTLMGERPAVVAEQGGSIAESLLGSDMVSKITGGISRASGIGGVAAQKILGFLTPMVLGGIARSFGGRSITPDALGSFFSEQKSSISQAMGGMGARFAQSLGSAAAPVRQAYAASRAAASRASWVLPVLLGLVIVIGIGWYLSYRRQGRPVVPTDTTTEPLGMPDFSQLSGELASMTGDLKDTLSGVKDSGTAEAAVTKVKELGGRLEDLKASASHLPAEIRSKFDDLLQPEIAKIEEESRRLSSIPGGDQVKPVLDDLVSRLKAPTSDVK